MGLNYGALRGRYNNYQENGVDDAGSGKPRKQILDLSSYKDVKFWKPEAGPHGVDIIPYNVTSKNHPNFKKGEVDYVLSVHVHRGVGPNNDNYLCMKETFGKPCPICEEMNNLHESLMADYLDKGMSQKEAWVKAKNDNDVKSMKPKHRVIYNLIDVDDREAGIQLYEAPHFWFEKPMAEKFVVKQARKPNTPFFFDLEQGFTVIVNSTDEEFSGKKFVKSEPMEFESRDVSYEEDLIDSAYPLDALLVIPTYEEVKNAFMGIETEEDDEDDVEDNEPPKFSAPSKPKANVPTPKAKEEPSEESREERMARIKAKQEAAKSGPECPVEGGEFGDDYCAYDECEDCPYVSECGEASGTGV
jgi:hypothetical protein